MAGRVAALMARALNSSAAPDAAALLAAASTAPLNVTVTSNDTAQVLSALQQGLQLVSDGASLRAQLLLGPPSDGPAPGSPACGPCCFFNEPDTRCVCLGVSPCPLAWALSRPALAALAGDA
jgi:hypothetical protein